MKNIWIQQVEVSEEQYMLYNEQTYTENSSHNFVPIVKWRILKCAEVVVQIEVIWNSHR